MDLDSQFLNSNAVYNYGIIAAADNQPNNPLSLTQLVNFIPPTLRYLFGNQNFPTFTEADIIRALPELRSATRLMFHHVYFILSHIFVQLNDTKRFNDAFNRDVTQDVRGTTDLELQNIDLYRNTEQHPRLVEELNERISAAKVAALRNRRMEIINAGGNSGAGKKRKTRKTRKSRKSRKSRKA